MSKGSKEPEFTLTEAQKKELDRRLAFLRKNPNAGVPWAEARKRLMRGRKK